MNVHNKPSYDPRTFRALTFHDAVPRFRDGGDSPRAYLERCLETIAAREPIVKAFTAMNEAGARAAADASTERWKAGKPLSLIDGMPIAIKDLLETRDMPTEMGCAAMKGNFPKRDNAGVWALRQAGAAYDLDLDAARFERALARVEAIAGDVTRPGLGLTESSRARIRRSTSRSSGRA